MSRDIQMTQVKKGWWHNASLLFVAVVLIAAAGNTDAQAPGGRSPRIDMDKIFPNTGPGRNLVINNCASCHTITPIVLIQMTRPARERWARDHRERVIALNDQDFKLIFEYLVKHFSPGQPIPQLPQELLDTWTNY